MRLDDVIRCRSSQLLGWRDETLRSCFGLFVLNYVGQCFFALMLLSNKNPVSSKKIRTFTMSRLFQSDGFVWSHEICTRHFKVPLRSSCKMMNNDLNLFLIFFSKSEKLNKYDWMTIITVVKINTGRVGRNETLETLIRSSTGTSSQSVHTECGRFWAMMHFYQHIFNTTITKRHIQTRRLSQHKMVKL